MALLGPWFPPAPSPTPAVAGSNAQWDPTSPMAALPHRPRHHAPRALSADSGAGAPPASPAPKPCTHPCTRSGCGRRFLCMRQNRQLQTSPRASALRRGQDAVPPLPTVQQHPSATEPQGPTGTGPPAEQDMGHQATGMCPWTPCPHGGAPCPHGGPRCPCGGPRCPCGRPPCSHGRPAALMPPGPCHYQHCPHCGSLADTKNACGFYPPKEMATAMRAAGTRTGMRGPSPEGAGSCPPGPGAPSLQAAWSRWCLGLPGIPPAPAPPRQLPQLLEHQHSPGAVWPHAVAATRTVPRCRTPRAMATPSYLLSRGCTRGRAARCRARLPRLPRPHTMRVTQEEMGSVLGRKSKQSTPRCRSMPCPHAP